MKTITHKIEKEGSVIMDYRKTAQEILGYVGGEAIENVDGVKGVFEASGQLQIILGTGTVNKVFDEFIAIAGITASTKAEAKEAAAEKQNWFMKAIKLLGDIFVPIIPASPAAPAHSRCSDTCRWS